MNARTLPAASSAARRFANRWQAMYPKAVACLRDREVRRRTRPMAAFEDRTSMGRILFATFIPENRNQGLATPHPLRPDADLLTSPRIFGAERHC